MVDVQKTGQDARAAERDQPTAALVRQLSEQMTTLVRDEMELARQEVRRKGRRFGAGAGALGTAGLLALTGAGTLLATVILAIDLALPAWLSTLIIGVALLGLAGIAAMAGRAEVRRGGSPLPEQTMTSVREDIDTVREGTRR